MTKNYSLSKAITHSLRGLSYILKHELNARIHLAVAILVMVLGVFLDLNDRELAAIFFAVLLVFLAEIFNSAIEKILDIVRPEPSDQVRLVKDMAAGAVLVASLGAFILGVAIFFPVILERLWAR